jgi:DNA repair protein RecO (recombination protein O)
MRLGEADRIVTFYTQAHGRVRGVAKGVRKSKSRFGGRLEGFTHVDLQLYRGRSDLDTVTQADIITRPHRIREDYASFCSASAMADAIDRTTPERERNVRVFLLLRSALQALEDGAVDPALLAYAFLAKLSSMSGHHPTLEMCVDCGSPGRVAFSYDRGGAVCGSCVDRVDPMTTEELLDSWTSLMEDEWEVLRGRQLPKLILRDLGALMVGFVQWHTESRFKAFALLPALAR